MSSLFDATVHSAFEGLETYINAEQQLIVSEMLASVVNKNNSTPITAWKEFGGTPQFSYRPACIEWNITEETARSDCTLPVETLTAALLPRPQAGREENNASTGATLPLSPEEMEKTIATLECDPSFSARVLQQTQSDNSYNLGYLEYNQQRASEQDLCRARISYHYNIGPPRMDETLLELRNPGVYQVKTEGQFRAKKRLHSCNGGSEKDELYWEKRMKNNKAAKKSRDAKRVKDIRIQEKAILLEEENKRLRSELSALKEENKKLKNSSS